MEVLGRVRGADQWRLRRARSAALGARAERGDGSGALGRCAGEGGEVGKKRRRLRRSPYLWGTSGDGFRVSRPRSPKSWVGSCSAYAGTWRRREARNGPHRRPQNANGSHSDPVRIRAREPEQRGVKSRGTRVSFCRDKTPGGTPL